ncbi:MAG: hypothetical protein P8Y58_12910 [Novosphingobium sp.]
MSEHKRSTSGGSQPISRHPLFPAIVALWFGALFGVGSIAIRPALIERAVLTLGIDSVMPMATPPLGATARVLIALVMTVLGAAIGALAALRLARQEPDMHIRRRNVAPVADDQPAAEEPAPSRARPLSGRRRALAVDPGRSTEVYAEPAPIPGQDIRILNVADFELDGFEDTADGSASPDGTQMAAPAKEHEEEPAAGHEPLPTPGAGTPGMSGQADTETPEPPLNNNLFETYSRGISVHSADEAWESPAAPTESPAPGFHSLGRLSEKSESRNIEAAPFVHPAALHSVTSGEDDRAPATEAAGTDDAGMDCAASHEPASISEGRKAAERIAAARLDELSPIELLERLALAMAQRRETMRRAPAAEPVPAPIEPQPAPTMELQPEPDAPETPKADVTASDSPATETPRLFAQPRFEAVPTEITEETASEAASDQDPETELPRIPAALHPVNFDDLLDDDEDVLPAYIPPRHIGLAPVEPTTHSEPEDETAHSSSAPLADEKEEPDEEESRVLEEGYSSLLDLSRPLAGREKPVQSFIRIEEAETESEIQPTVIFPGEDAHDARPFAGPKPSTPSTPATRASQTPASKERLFDAPGKTDPEETEQALRAALAALQRMSGAA